MELCYIDAHCHLQFDDYDADREELVEEMRVEEIGAVVVGTNLASSRAAVALAERHEHLWAAVGIHPNEISDITCPISNVGHGMSDLRALAEHPKVVAIGECGLDYFKPQEVTDEVKEKQKELFKAHIALAVEAGKPLVIHARPSKETMDAYDDVFEIIRDAKREHPSLRGDMHFFAGDLPTAEKFISLGFTLSFTAVITFARAYDDVIRAAPLASLLAETDAPYVAPASRRGERNDSLAIPEVVAKMAEIRGDDLETIREALLANTRELFAC